MVNGFQDNFSGTALDPNWVVSGANVYSIGGGALHVASAGGNPNHLLYELPGYSNTVQEVLARVRVTSFGSGDGCRGGVAVGVPPPALESIICSAGVAARASRATTWRCWPTSWPGGRGRRLPGKPTSGTGCACARSPMPRRRAGSTTSLPRPGSPTATRLSRPAGSLPGIILPGMSRHRSPALRGSALVPGHTVFDVDYILIKAGGLPLIQVAPAASLRSGAATPSFPAESRPCRLCGASRCISTRR